MKWDSINSLIGLRKSLREFLDFEFRRKCLLTMTILNMLILLLPKRIGKKKVKFIASKINKVVDHVGPFLLLQLLKMPLTLKQERKETLLISQNNNLLIAQLLKEMEVATVDGCHMLLII